jgi:hypothetical protein
MRIQSSTWQCCAALVIAGTAVACESRTPLDPAPTETAARLESQPPSTDFAVNAQLTVVRQATARFHTLSAAEAEGYSIENEPCVSSPAGGMGIHAPNLPLILDPTLNPSRPELLLYERQASGAYRLTGVEYFQAVILRNKVTGVEAPRLDPTPWNPTEFEVVNPRPELFGEHFHLAPPPAPHVPWHYALHVWIWAQNPSGMFADWNPTVRCS